MTASLVLMEPPVVMMTKMFLYITAIALTTTVVETVKVRNACYFFCHFFFYYTFQAFITRKYFRFYVSVPSFSKIACFETASSLLPDALGNFKDLVKDNKFQQAISACAELAFDKSYKFFALGYHGICRSGPNARQQYHSKRSLSDMKCPNGIGIDKCIEVYTFGKFTLGRISLKHCEFSATIS